MEMQDLINREIPEEFDEDFLINNPSVVRQRANHLFDDEPPSVNLPNNNDQKLKNFGLNSNKRGHIKQQDQ